MKELAYEIANAPSARGRVVLGKIEWSRYGYLLIRGMQSANFSNLAFYAA